MFSVAQKSTYPAVQVSPNRYNCSTDTEGNFWMIAYLNKIKLSTECGCIPFLMFYKTDILLLLLFLLPISMFMYYLTWKYKPPVFVNREVRNLEMKRIIQGLRNQTDFSLAAFDYHNQDIIANEKDKQFGNSLSYGWQESTDKKYDYNYMNKKSSYSTKSSGNIFSKERTFSDSPIYKNKTNKYKPSRLKGGAAHCSIYDLRGDINETYECVPAKVKPAINICLYPSEEDMHISRHLRDGILWEAHIVEQLQEILATDLEYGLIDIGANIGVYTLVAARTGHKVVAVEPIITNIKHLHMSAVLNGLTDNITVLRNGVYDEHKNTMLLIPNVDNQGGIALDPTKINQCIQPSCIYTTKTILMDDLLEVINFRKAVIKIDIEGFEHRAFRYSEQLFDQVEITHIIMEWMQLRDYYGSEVDTSVDKDLTRDLVVMLYERGFKPHSLVTGSELKMKYWYAWPENVIWK